MGRSRARRKGSPYARSHAPPRLPARLAGRPDRPTRTRQARTRRDPTATLCAQADLHRRQRTRRGGPASESGPSVAAPEAATWSRRGPLPSRAKAADSASASRPDSVAYGPEAEDSGSSAVDGGGGHRPAGLASRAGRGRGRTMASGGGAAAGILSARGNAEHGGAGATGRESVRAGAGKVGNRGRGSAAQKSYAASYIRRTRSSRKSSR